MSSPTGQFSHHRPNLQNIPLRTAEGARVREVFFRRCQVNHPWMGPYTSMDDMLATMFGFRTERVTK